MPPTRGVPVGLLELGLGVHVPAHRYAIERGHVRMEEIGGRSFITVACPHGDVHQALHDLPRRQMVEMIYQHQSERRCTCLDGLLRKYAPIAPAPNFVCQ